jgi:hypothetical protein
VYIETLDPKDRNMLNTPREMANALLFDFGYTHAQAVEALFQSVKDGSYSNVPASYWAAVVRELNSIELGV